MRINVTKNDIALGVPHDGSACPVARALRRHKGYEEAHVERDYIVVNDGAWSAKYPNSDRVTQFIRSFDYRRESVRPFSFTFTPLTSPL